MRITEEEYAKLTGKQIKNTEPKKSKYKNKRVWIDGVSFDSMKEGNYYAESKLRIRAGLIKAIALKPKFVVAEGIDRTTTYICDFIEIDNKGKAIVIDVKPSEEFQTDMYKIKKALMWEKYGIEIKEVYE